MISIQWSLNIKNKILKKNNEKPNIKQDYTNIRVFTHGPRDQGSIPGHTKDSKNGTWCLLA